VRAAVGVAVLLGILVATEDFREDASAWAQGRGVRYDVLPEGSEVRYRVREQLVGLSLPNDAVGATSAVQGAIVFDAQGRLVPGDSRFTVDLRTLRSDEARRDNYVRRNTLETDRYPTVAFAPVEARGLSTPLPASGSVPFELVGDLTVKETTRRVSWSSVASFEGPRVIVRARTAFRFGDFGLRIPRVSVVLSVEDDIKLEADLVLRRGTEGVSHRGPDSSTPASAAALRLPRREDQRLDDPPLGVAEAASAPVPAAPGNAVFGPTGVRLRVMPVRRDRVKAALAAART
jgi:polyisoprenoid-binding protein YceI